MKLWIRSQNKGALIKVEMLGNTDGIIHSYLGINKTILGEYKSSERALEVLDEIQNKIIQNNKTNEVEYKKIEMIDENRILILKPGDIFYEMPKE